MVTSRDVARLAGVSQATVSRVIRKSANVSDSTRAKVLKVLDETGYTPNAAATAMRTQRTGTIGVVVDRVTNPFYPEMLEALGADLERRDLRLILWNASVGAGERAAVDAIEGGLVDGLLFTTATTESVPLQSALQRRAPVVLVNRVVDGLPYDQVDSDNESSSAAVAHYFAHHGHEHVGLVRGPALASTARGRMAGFVEAAEALGLEVLSDAASFDAPHFSHESGVAQVSALLAADVPPTAVFCVNDLSAFGAIDGARAHGVDVPDDLWVVGFDDIEMASWQAYDLTTAAQPTGRMIGAAVDLLLARIDDPSAPIEHRRFANEIVVRGSTAHAALPPDKATP